MDIDLNVQGSSALVLRDLSEYLNLPFMAAFGVQEAQKDDSREVDRKTSNKRVTYIGLTKKVMPTLVELFNRFKEYVKVYEDETFEAIVAVSNTLCLTERKIMTRSNCRPFRSPSK